MAKPLVAALGDFGRTTGDYWSKDNAQFESTNPGFGSRVGRALNPMTSFGSAVGAFSDAAGNGFNPRETGLALLQALPTFGGALTKTIAGTGAVKASKAIKDISLEKYLAGGTVSAGIDEAQAQGNNRGPIDPMSAAIQQAERKPYQSELDYFKKNPHVAGMASEDNRVVANPYSKISPEEMQAVKLNEFARLHMRKNGAPEFQLTDEQHGFLNGNTYKDATPADRASTIAARILTGDPSAGKPSDEQVRYVTALRNSMMQGSK